MYEFTWEKLPPYRGGEGRGKKKKKQYTHTEKSLSAGFSDAFPDNTQIMFAAGFSPAAAPVYRVNVTRLKMSGRKFLLAFLTYAPSGFIYRRLPRVPRAD